MTPMPKKIQAKDIGDVEILRAISRACYALDDEYHWAMRWNVKKELGDRFPERVVLAKLRALEKRGLIEGCLCGCRGDIEATRAGAELAGLDVIQPGVYHDSVQVRART